MTDKTEDDFAICFALVLLLFCFSVPMLLLWQNNSKTRAIVVQVKL